MSQMRKTVDQHIKEQRDWIREHGGHRSGYVARYGSKKDPVHYGDGGELIYEADLAQLNFLLELKEKGRKYL